MLSDTRISHLSVLYHKKKNIRGETPHTSRCSSAPVALASRTYGAPCSSISRISILSQTEKRSYAPVLTK